MFRKTLIFLLIPIVFWGCQIDNHTRNTEFRNWLRPNDKIKVLCTTAMICNLVEEIGGDATDILVLIHGNLDPHSYQLVKGDDEKLAAADVIFSNGLGLEHGPSLQHYLQSSEKNVALGDLIQNQYSKKIIHWNGTLDPHIWMDVSLWSKTIPFIVDKLKELDPDHGDVFTRRSAELQQKLDQVHRDMKEELQSVPDEKRFLVTSHDAFNYFARAYLATEAELKANTWEKRFAAPEGLAPDSQLSSTNIREILEHLTIYQISVIFPESNVSKDSIWKIVSAGTDMGLKLRITEVALYGDAMGDPGSSGDTYIKMMQHNAKTIAEHLKGKQ